MVRNLVIKNHMVSTLMIRKPCHSKPRVSLIVCKYHFTLQQVSILIKYSISMSVVWFRLPLLPLRGFFPSFFLHHWNLYYFTILTCQIFSQTLVVGKWFLFFPHQGFIRIRWPFFHPLLLSAPPYTVFACVLFYLILFSAESERAVPS